MMREVGQKGLSEQCAMETQNVQLGEDHQINVSSNRFDSKQLCTLAYSYSSTHDISSLYHVSSFKLKSEPNACRL